MVKSVIKVHIQNRNTLMAIQYVLCDRDTKLIELQHNNMLPASRTQVTLTHLSC